jgi:hypothetical protein
MQPCSVKILRGSGLRLELIKEGNNEHSQQSTVKEKESSYNLNKVQKYSHMVIRILKSVHNSW